MFPKKINCSNNSVHCFLALQSYVLEMIQEQVCKQNCKIMKQVEDIIPSTPQDEGRVQITWKFLNAKVVTVDLTDECRMRLGTLPSVNSCIFLPTQAK